MRKLNKVEDKSAPSIKIHYTKLTEDYPSSSCESVKVVPPASLADYLSSSSYTCKHCGHTQSIAVVNESQTSEQVENLTDSKKNDVYLNVEEERWHLIHNQKYDNIVINPSTSSTIADENNLDNHPSNNHIKLNSPSRINNKHRINFNLKRDEKFCSAFLNNVGNINNNMEIITPTSLTGIIEEDPEEHGDDEIYRGLQINTACNNFILNGITNRDELKLAPWYQEGIPREIALEILSQEPVGSFMVRKSTTKLDCYALSVRVPYNFQLNGIAHYLIIKTKKNGYRIKGFTKEFSSLIALITHHSVMPELLPCPLSLSRYSPIFVISDSRKDFADIDKCL